MISTQVVTLYCQVNKTWTMNNDTNSMSNYVYAYYLNTKNGNGIKDMMSNVTIEQYGMANQQYAYGTVFKVTIP